MNTQTTSNKSLIEENTTMVLTHYSAKPLISVVTTNPIDPLRDDKPKGLWLTHGDTWLNHLKDNSYTEGCYMTNKTEVEVTGHILHITSTLEAASFYCEYKKEKTTSHVPGIDWGRVGRIYDGIMVHIEAYDYSDEDTRWLEYWDITSMCVWNGKCQIVG